MRVEALQEMYAPLVEEGAAKYVRDNNGKVTAVWLTQVDHGKLEAFVEKFAKEEDKRFAESDRLQREAASKLGF